MILLAGSGKPVLLDFGAARRVISDMTQALTVILKPGYAPVEQYAEAASMKQGPWTDVYALAASVYFAILGKTPPPSVSRLMGDAYQPLAELAAGRYSARFLRAIDQALQVRPQERTQSIEAFRAALGLGGAVDEPQPSQILVKPPASRAAPLPTPPPAGGAPRRKGLVMAAAVAVVGCGVAAYMFITPTLAPKPASPPPDAVVQAPAAPAAISAPALPPAPAPATAPPVATPEPFEVQREFDKVVAAQTAGFDVRATAAKAQLRIGRDQLRFSVFSARAGYVTVLVAGPDGSLLQLFPNSKAPRNQIAAGQTLNLPHKDWMLDTVPPAGAERFLVIVSERPRDYSTLGTGREFYFLKLPTGDAATRTMAQSGRSTPFLLGQAKDCSGPACDAFGAALLTVDVVDR